MKSSSGDVSYVSAAEIAGSMRLRILGQPPTMPSKACLASGESRSKPECSRLRRAPVPSGSRRQVMVVSVAKVVPGRDGRALWAVALSGDHFAGLHAPGARVEFEVVADDVAGDPPFCAKLEVGERWIKNR